MGSGTRTLDDFEIIVDRKEVYAKHRCFDKGQNGSSSPEGRVVSCKDCGKHWFVRESWLYETLLWKPVRWYHYKMRRAIVGK